ARLAPEVLLHPVCSKISSHAFDAHLDMFDLRLQLRHGLTTSKQQQREFPFHVPPFLAMQTKLLRDAKTDAPSHGHKQCSICVCDIPIHSQPHMHSRTQANV